MASIGVRINGHGVLWHLRSTRANWDLTSTYLVENRLAAKNTREFVGGKAALLSWLLVDRFG